MRMQYELGGGGGIRTHEPFQAVRFQGECIMTALPHPLNEVLFRACYALPYDSGRRDRNRTCNLRIWRPLLCLIELPAFDAGYNTIRRISVQVAVWPLEVERKDADDGEAALAL